MRQGISYALGLAIGISFDRLRSLTRGSYTSQEPGSDGAAGSIAVLGFCALVASVIPAQRTASINPVEALRAE